MKVKVHAVDVEIPMRVKKWGLRIGIPVAVLVVAGVAFAGLPGGYADGQPLTAEALTNNFNYLQSEIALLQAAQGDGGAPTSSSVPVGTIVAYGGPIDSTHPVPAGWLLCDGTAVSRTTYANLFLNAVGVAYGYGDQVATFNVPNLQGYFLRGLDPSGTTDPNAASRTAEYPGGNTTAKVGTVEVDGFASHNHGFSDPGHVHGAGGGINFVTQTGGPGIIQAGFNFGYSSTSAASGTNITFNANGGAETRPKNVAVNYIIKY